MNIIVSKEARKDLIQIRKYIAENLNNPTAAVRIMKLLKESIASLTEFPAKGRSLDALISVHTGYRYLTCENYCVFYLSDDHDIVIVRVLHQRQDCLRALFMEH